MTPKRILIYLHAEQANWLIADETGQTIQSVLNGNLGDLTASTQGCQIDVIVPGQSILLTKAQLPQLSGERLKQALPFALEEQLIEDVTELHFAIGSYQPDHHYFPVAVVAKEKMDHWISELKKINIVPNAFISATTALPFAPENVYACIDDEIAIVRTGEYTGFTCDKANLSTFLQFQLASMEQKITDIHLYNFSDSSAALTLDNIIINEVMLSRNQFLEHLLKWTSTYPFINLLQGTYRASKKTTTTKKIWMAAAGLAVVWIVFVFFSNIVSFFLLHQATTLSEQQIEKIYKRNFPEAVSVIAPRQRMEDKLKKLSISSTKNNFLAILAIVGDSLSKSKGIELLNLDYRNNQLSLNITAASFLNLDVFTQTLIHQNLNVKQQSASVAGTAVKANLLITQGIL